MIRDLENREVTTLTILERKNPFEPGAERSQVSIVPGWKIADYLTDRNCGEKVITLLDGHVIPPEKRYAIAPRPGQQLVISADLGGGGGGKGILRALAMVAVMALAIAFPFIAAAAGWAISAGLMVAIQAGIALGGSLLVNALLPPSSPQNNASTFSWGGPQMTAQEGLPIPVQYGTILRSGNVIESYLDETLTQEWLNLLIDFGFGPAALINDIRINGNPITNYPGIWTETRLGHNEQEPLPYFNDIEVNYPQNVRLRSAGVGAPATDGFTVVGTGTDTTGFRLEFTFPNGLWSGPNDDGDYESWSVYISCNYRKVGDLDWTSVLYPRTTETLNGASPAPYWIAVAPGYTPNENNTVFVLAVSYGAQDHYVGQPYTATESVPVYDANGDEVGLQTQTVTGSWQINPYGPGASSASVPGANYVTITDWTNATRVFTWNQTLLCRGTVQIDGLEPAQYEYLVIKVGSSQGGAPPATTTEDSPRRGEQTWFTNLTEITTNDLSYPNHVLLAVRALATDQLSGSDLNVTAVIQMAPTQAMGYKNEVAYDQPTAYWRLGDSGGTAADLTGQGHDGAYAGSPVKQQPALVVGSPDGAVQFATGDSVGSISSLTLSGNWVFECWIKPTALGGKLLSNSDASVFIGLDSSGKINFHFGGTDHLGSAVLSLNAVHHVCVGPFVGGFLIMVDGVPQYPSITPPTSWTPVQLGGGFAGLMDEAAVYGTIQPGRLRQHYITGTEGLHSAMEEESPSNPAMVAMDMLLNPLYGGQQPPALIDVPSFEAAAEFNDELVSNGSGGEIYRHIFNGLFDQVQSLWKGITQVGQMSRSVFMRTGTSYTVVCEAPAARTQLFTMGNIKLDSFKQSWPALLDRANVVSGTFMDETNNWKRTPLRVMDEAAIAAGAPLQEAPSADLFGITNPWAAWRELMYRLLASKAALQTLQLDCGIEGLAARVGDVVGVQHDVPQWGAGGRILKVISLDQVQLDQQVTIAADTSYVLMVVMPSVIRASGTVAGIIGNTVTVDTTWDGTTNVSRLYVGTADYKVLEASVTSGVATLLLKDAPGFSTSAACSLADTSVIETHNVTNAPGTTDTITLDADFSSPPPDYSTYFFGQLTDIQDFRLSAVGRSKDQELTLQLTKYDPTVYGDLEPNLPPSAVILGPNLVLNPGFELNTGSTATGTPLSASGSCSDNWTVITLNSPWVVELERDGKSNTGQNNLLIRMPAGSISGTPSAQVATDPITVTPGARISFSGYTVWGFDSGSGGAIPSGVTIVQRVSIQFFDASNTLISEVVPGDLVNLQQSGSIYTKSQVATAAVPANAETARLVCSAFVTGGSGTSTGLCADLRFDDVSFQVGEDYVSVSDLTVSETPSTTPQYPTANIAWRPGKLTYGARVYLTREGLPEFLAADPGPGVKAVQVAIFQGYTYTVRVVGYDKDHFAAPYAAAPTATIAAQGTALMPQNVSGFYCSACTAGGSPSVTLNWTDNAPTDNVDHYEIRYGGTISNPLWESSTPLTPNPSSSSSSETYSGYGPGFYLIMAVNTNGVYSAAPTICQAVVGGSSGGSGGGGYGGGGGTGCPCEEIFVGEGLRAGDALVGALLVCLRGSWVPRDNRRSFFDRVLRWWNRVPRPVLARRLSREECVRIEAANGAAWRGSLNTPVPTAENRGITDPEDPRLRAVGIVHGDHVLTDVGRGLEWSPVVRVQRLGLRRVVRLYAGGRNFAGGEQWGKVIYTHNVVVITK